MSKFKKMKLVPINEEDTNKKTLNEILNILKISTTPYLKKASNLDGEIQKVLNANLNDYQKVKLYSNTLIKFLKAKEKYEDINNQMVQSIVATKALEPPTIIKQRKRPLKKLKAKRIKKAKREDILNKKLDDAIDSTIDKTSFDMNNSSTKKIDFNFDNLKEFDPLNTSFVNKTPDRVVKLKKSERKNRKPRETKTAAIRKTQQILNYEAGVSPRWEDY